MTSKTKTQNEKRWVYGTRSRKWYLVGTDDRDYETGVTQEKFSSQSESDSREQYLTC